MTNLITPDSAGKIAVKTLAATAIGADDLIAIYSPGTPYRGRFMCAIVTLVTDATVANRFMIIRIKKGTTVVWEGGASAAIPASKTAIMDIHQGDAGQSSGTAADAPTTRDYWEVATFPIGPIYLEDSDSVEIFVKNGANADTIAANVLVEEWIAS